MSAVSEPADGFGGPTRRCVEEALNWLKGAEAARLGHGELEGEIDRRGRELVRRMLQDHLTLRAREIATPAGDDLRRGRVRAFAYRHRGHHNLYPGDAALNLRAAGFPAPVPAYSLGIGKVGVVDAAVVARIADSGVERRFERLYDNFAGTVERNADAAVRRSADRYIAWTRGDHDDVT